MVTSPRTRRNPHSSPLPTSSIGTMKETVLGLLEKSWTCKAIAKKVSRHRTTIQGHLKDLVKMGLAEHYKTTGGHWGFIISDFGKEYLKSGNSNVMYESEGVGATSWLQSRSHNVKLKVPVMRTPKNDDWLNEWKSEPMKHHTQYRIKFGDITTLFTGKSFCFQLPVLRFESPEVAMLEAGRIGRELANKYEREVFGLKLGDPKVSSIQAITQHHAIEGDPFAKFCKRHGFTFRDENIDIDASDGTPELEFTDSEKAHIHCERYIEHTKDIILNDVPTMSEMTKLLNEVLKNQKTTAEQLRKLAQVVVQ